MNLIDLLISAAAIALALAMAAFAINKVLEIALTIKYFIEKWRK